MFVKSIFFATAASALRTNPLENPIVQNRFPDPDQNSSDDGLLRRNAINSPRAGQELVEAANKEIEIENRFQQLGESALRAQKGAEDAHLVLETLKKMPWARSLQEGDVVHHIKKDKEGIVTNIDMGAPRTSNSDIPPFSVHQTFHLKNHFLFSFQIRIIA